jgi:hypothetical protein
MQAFFGKISDSSNELKITPRDDYEDQDSRVFFAICFHDSRASRVSFGIREDPSTCSPSLRTAKRFRHFISRYLRDPTVYPGLWRGSGRGPVFAPWTRSAGGGVATGFPRISRRARWGWVTADPPFSRGGGGSPCLRCRPAALGRVLEAERGKPSPARPRVVAAGTPALSRRVRPGHAKSKVAQRVSGRYLMRCGWSASLPRRRRRSSR